LSNTAPQIRHTVTAIIVAHDGARLLPGLVQALRAQTYPVEHIVGVDTGSRDRSGSVLAELIGQGAVFGMERGTGYGEAVAVAVRHAGAPAARTDPRRIEWIWLLHDDCEPATETLERLLRAASRDRSVVVLGPKVLDWSDRRVLREVGVSIDRAGRRVSGVEPGEIDQGQHDSKRAVMAVGSAGMLIRRDVWDRLGGFDARLKLFRDDVDFCWRVHGAGLRVQVVTDAVLYHRELSARRRRTSDGRAALLGETSQHPRKLDRRNALYVLAVNLPLLTMLRVMAGCVAGSLVRAAYFLLSKQLDLAAAQIYAVGGLLGHPLWLWKGRRSRARGCREGYSAVRMFIPPGRTLSRLAENIAGLLSSGPAQASGGMHHAASDAPEDEQFVDAQSVVRRIIGHPGVQLVATLLVIALIAERRLLGTSPLGGGALVPAWDGALALWQEYLAGFHAVGVGSTASAPPYLAVVAALATVLGGQAWLAVDVLLLGCVPLAGLTAYLAARRLVTVTAARIWLAATYALIPVATGAVAAGRLGSAVAFALLPLIGLNAARVLTAPPRAARRAAWATGLLLALGAAFAPVLWVFGAAFVVIALAARHWLWRVSLVDAAIVVATPFAVLFPWSLHLLASPSAFFTEAGVQPTGLTSTVLKPSALLLLSPGGPGLPPVWVTAGIGLAVLAALLPHRRAAVTATGWCVAAVGYLGAVVVARASTAPAGGSQAATGWPGAALAVAALGLLVAAAPAVEWLAVGWTARGLARKLVAGAAVAVAATAPVLAAGYWVADGVQGPVGSVTAPVLPAFVSASSNGGGQYRTLIMRENGGSLDYSVVRQGDPSLGEPELTASSSAEQALSGQVSALAAPDGADAGDPGLVLGEFGIRWVLLPAPVDPALAQLLDASVGLVPLSKSSAYDLWQVTGPVARVRVIAPDGSVTTLASQSVGMSAAAAPAAGGTLELAEPYGGWTATLNGTALKPLAAPVDGWAQGFVLPPGGGEITITRNDTARDLSLIAELVLLLAVCALALPGKRANPVAEAEALAAVRAAQHSKRTAQRPGRAGLAARAGRAGLAARAGRAGRPGRAARAGLAGRAAAGFGGGRRRSAARAGGAAGDVPAGSGVGLLADTGEADQTAQSDERGQWDETDAFDDGAQWDEGADWDEPARLSGPQLSGPQPAAAWGSGPQPEMPRGADPRTATWAADSRNPRSTGAQPAAPWETDPRGASWDTGPQRAWRTGPQHALGSGPQHALGSGPQHALGSGPQPTWDSGPRQQRGSGPQPTWDSGPRQQRGSGPQPTWDSDQPAAWDSGPQPEWDSGPHEPRGTGPRPAWGTGQGTGPRAAWDSGPERVARPVGPREAWQPDAEPAARQPVAGRPGPEKNAPVQRHSHRAGRHGRPGRRRAPGDQSSPGGES
jgi:GT2 family glycosyltransferase